MPAHWSWRGAAWNTQISPTFWLTMPWHFFSGARPQLPPWSSALCPPTFSCGRCPLSFSPHNWWINIYMHKQDRSRLQSWPSKPHSCSAPSCAGTVEGPHRAAASTFLHFCRIRRQILFSIYQNRNRGQLLFKVCLPLRSHFKVRFSSRNQSALKTKQHQQPALPNSASWEERAEGKSVCLCVRPD